MLAVSFHTVNLHLYICASGESNSKVNVEHTDYILTPACALLLMALATKAVVRTRVKEDNDLFASDA